MSEPCFGLIGGFPKLFEILMFSIGVAGTFFYETCSVEASLTDSR